MAKETLMFLRGLTLPTAITQLEGMHFAGLPVGHIQAVSAVIDDQLVRDRHGASACWQLDVSEMLAVR